MKNRFKKIILTMVSITLIGCSNMDSRTAKGGAIGAVAGAGIGQVVGHDTESTLIGAALGAIGGALIGNAQE